ncbi:MAG: hypothetical protein AABX23_02035 [Nanoarchaeota archaeon]
MGDGRPRPLKGGMFAFAYSFLSSVRYLVNEDYQIPHRSNPDLHKSLERALEEAPQDLKEMFHFRGSVFSMSEELDDLITIGQDAMLIETADRGYKITFSRWNAKDILKESRYDKEQIGAIQSLAKRFVENLAQPRTN